MDRRLKASRWHRRRRRRLLRRFTLLLSLVVIVGIVFVFVRPHHPGAMPAVRSTPTPTRTVTSWLHAGAPWTSTEIDRLRHDLTATFASDAFPPTTGVLVIDGRTGQTLYSRNAHLGLVPGSTMKLVTAAAALGMLGPSHRFVTPMVSDGVREASTLRGSVWLVGSGDPELTSDDLRRGVRDIRESGIANIQGNVYADGSRYGKDGVNAGWDPDDLQYGWAAPASALSIDGGSVQFTITPRVGTQADVAVDPPGVRVVASVDTASSSADNTLRIDALPGNGYEVRGQIPYGATQKYWRAIPHPTQVAARALLTMLQLGGISVTGSASEGRAPHPTTVLWQHHSRTLDLIVKHMFFLSDNHYAEELLRAVGWQATGDGTLSAALSAERDFLRDHNIPSAHNALADGSGLSAQNRLTAQTLAATLQYLLRQPLAEPPYTLLPRAGMEGTVAVRNLSAQAKGRVFAKDGYIGGASTIAGYILTAHHGPVIFAFLVNDWASSLDAIWANEDTMLSEIASN